MVETIDSISTSRIIRESQKAYIGVFEDRIVTSQIFCDYYQLGFSQNNLGFHIRGLLEIGPHIPRTSIRFGILFSAMKKDDDASIVNFEIFYGLNDVFESDEEDDLLKRNSFGLQTTFPIKLNR